MILQGKTNDVILLDSQGVRDFQTCDRLYDYRHNQQLKEPFNSDDMLSRRFENTLRSVVMYFFFQQQGGEIPTYNQLLFRWQKAWFPKDVTAYQITLEKHSIRKQNKSTLATKATRLLLKFYEDFTDPDFSYEVVMVNEEFDYSINNKFRLQGVFDIVLKDRKTQELLVIKISPENQKPVITSTILDMAALKYGWDRRSEGKKYQPVKYYIYDIASSNWGLERIRVDEDDMATLFYWIDRVQQEKYYPSRWGLLKHCANCPFNKPCSDFKITQEEYYDI